uniref:non-specific serine/threonine protein kinase n=1 Tax=Graphocephala atropunctata TaxID=36148 RepID=A0A1B6LEI1_9HEMI
MDSKEDVCDAGPEALVYSLQMEWLGLDGRPYVNNSVRIEWTEEDSRAVCEMPTKLSDSEFAPQEVDISGHCGRCLVQVFAFTALILLLLRGLGAQTARPPSFPPPALPIQTCQHVPKRICVSELLLVSKRSMSAAAVLQSCFTKPLVTARSEPRDFQTNDPVEAQEEELLNSEDDEEQEDHREYCRGGYHPVNIGDLFHCRYEIVRKLGWGHFSTVWLCWDLLEKEFVALKVVKSAPHYTETALDEIKLLKRVREADTSDPNRKRVVRLLNDFKMTGQNGTHVCMVFEVLGHNLLKLIIRSNYQGIPLENVKVIVKQVLEGLVYLHTKCNIIHTDIKPENILLCVDDSYVLRIAWEAANCWKRFGRLRGITPSELKTYKSFAEFEVGSCGTGSEESSAVVNLPPETSNGNNASSCNENGNSHSSTTSELGAEAAAVVSSSASSTYSTEASSISVTTDTKAGKFRKVMSCPDHQELRGENKDPVHQVCNISVKIADLGNACWVTHHFTEDIQTRQYRSLEVLLGCGYGPPADIWSTACMAFELATGDFLFEPHSGTGYNRDEDHLAHIVELLGAIPPHIINRGKNSKDYFTSSGELKHISKLKPWSMSEVLIEKYGWPPSTGRAFAEFLTPMLEFDPDRRWSAAQCLAHPWLQS